MLMPISVLWGYEGGLSTCWTGWVHSATVAFRSRWRCHTTGPGCPTLAHAFGLSDSAGTRVCSSLQPPASRTQHIHTQVVETGKKNMLQSAKVKVVMQKRETIKLSTNFTADICCNVVFICRREPLEHWTYSPLALKYRGSGSKKNTFVKL